MDFLIFVLVGLTLSVCEAVPHYPLFRMYEPQPYVEYNHPLPRPAIFAPLPPLRRRVNPTASTLIQNTITYNVNPEADPDDALEVAQFHSQDSAGRVVFGFNTPSQTRMEARALDGSVRGSYSYQDPTGKTVKMHYWDDGSGFHTSGNNLPANFFSPPGYTPEVQAARERHFQLYNEALAAAVATGSGSEDEESQPENTAVEVESADPAKTQEDRFADSTKSDEKGYDSDSSDAVEIENPDFSSLRMGNFQGTEPEATRKQVAEVTDLSLDKSSLAIARTGPGGYQYLVPVAEPPHGHSESLHATLYGAIPVAAVHDTQVSPVQRENIEDHQLKPVLIRTSLAKSS